MNIDIFERKDTRGGFLAIEKATIIYGLVTLAIILLLYGRLENPQNMLIARGAIFAITVLLTCIFHYYPSKIMAFVRVGFQLSLLSYWYPETYEINKLFPNLDHMFADIEQAIFSSQPSLTFSEKFSRPIVSEALNMGYFFYYPMMLFVCAYYFFAKFKNFEKVSFILIFSFFIYYIIYMFLPVSGPQFYFDVIGTSCAEKGIFPSIGTYFNENSFNMLPAPGYKDGFFYHLVEQAQQAGERPTAAFPSSHVGISTILMIMAKKGSKVLFFVMLPFYLLLCGATVYIQAHYLIDAIAGLVSGVLIYYMSKFIYEMYFSYGVFYEETSLWRY